jgi:hypothetical protein
MNLRRRLDALEKGLMGAEPIVLHMPDGRTETIPSRGNYMFDLFLRACQGERTPEMELIARSISSIEPDGAHMVDLVRICLNGPASRDRVHEYERMIRETSGRQE